MCSSPRPIKSFSIEEIRSLFSEIGLPSFRVNQLLEWLYVKAVSSYDEMTNLPKSLREQLASSFPLHASEVLQALVSSDNSRKYLLRLNDNSLVETVGIPSESGRLTVCVSTQSGCAMNCAFCATGKAGFTRNLFPGEIVDQINVVQKDFEERISNVVLMGQGEPFANYDNVLAALRIINHPKLINIGARRLTVSTCGLLDGIRKFSNEPEQFTLAVSLHAAQQSTRDYLIPAMKSQRLDTLHKVLEEYIDRTGRRVTFEYALMKDLNDSNEDLVALLEYCHNLLCHVNLIPLNDIPGSEIKPSSPATLNHWNEKLLDSGVTSSIRHSRGSDIAAACGQLASQYSNN